MCDFFPPHLFYFLFVPRFRAAGRRLIHLLILHAERQTVRSGRRDASVWPQVSLQGLPKLPNGLWPHRPVEGMRSPFSQISFSLRRKIKSSCHNALLLSAASFSVPVLNLKCRAKKGQKKTIDRMFKPVFVIWLF